MSTIEAMKMLAATILALFLQGVSGRPATMKNSTTIVHAGNDVPITINNYLYCDQEANTSEKWTDITEKVRSRRNCVRTLYGFPAPHHEQQDIQQPAYIQVTTPIPQMDLLTACMSFDSGDNGQLSGTLLSYATEKNVNSLIIFGEVERSGQKTIQIFINSEGTSYAINLPPNEWIHMCVKFDILNGEATMYLNGDFVAKSEYKGGVPIDGSGVLIVGQEQDRILDGFDPAQAFHGKIADFMLWDRILTDTEIKNMGKATCSCVGDYVVSLEPQHVRFVGDIRSLQSSTCLNTGKHLNLG